MEVNRKGNQLILTLDSEDEAVGLYAYLSGTIHEVPPETASKGAWLYTWFFTSIQKLALNFVQERSVTTMSAEAAPGLPVSSNTPSKRTRRR